LDETLTVRFGSAKTKDLIPVLAIPSYGLPHNKVVSPEMLVPKLRCAIFINCLLSKMKKYCTRDILFINRCKDHESQVFRNDMIMYFFEKIGRLRR
jgi:hypothetical protein